MSGSTLLVDSSSRPTELWGSKKDLCDRLDGSNHHGNTGIDVTNVVTIDTLLWTITRAVNV